MSRLMPSRRLSGPNAEAPRRSFLRLAVCAPTAAVAALLGGASSPAIAALPKPADAAAPPRSVHISGYHRSAHIDTYYDSLRY
jgi:hypothetical protein